MFDNFIYNFKFLNKTIESTYGKGILGYIRFIHTSFLKINIFYIYTIDVTSYVNDNNVDDIVYSKDIIVLKDYRKNKKLPKQYYMDVIDGLKNCCLILCENDIAHIHWVVESGDTSRFLKIDKHHVEINHVLTLQKYRNLHIYRKAIVKTLSNLKNVGVTHAFVVINSNTVISRHVIESIGWKECRRIRTFGRLNFKYKTDNILL